jgi:hypothetical protein
MDARGNSIGEVGRGGGDSTQADGPESPSCA